MANPKTLTMMYMVLFSHRTVQLPVGWQQIDRKNAIEGKDQNPQLPLTVGAVVPVARAGCVQACAVLLQHHAVDCGRQQRRFGGCFITSLCPSRTNVFEGLAEGREPLQALLDNVGRPLADLGVLVGALPNALLDGLDWER